MPAPVSETYSASAKVAAHTALRDLIDGGVTAGKLRIFDASDVLLWETALSDPCGTVNGTTGQLTITVPAGTVNAAASGTAAWGALTDSTNAAIWSAPAQAGTAAVSGNLVINTLAIVSGAPVAVVSITVG